MNFMVKEGREAWTLLWTELSEAWRLSPTRSECQSRIQPFPILMKSLQVDPFKAILLLVMVRPLIGEDVSTASK